MMWDIAAGVVVGGILVMMLRRGVLLLAYGENTGGWLLSIVAAGLAIALIVWRAR